jgi:hypothetical protein
LISYARSGFDGISVILDCGAALSSSALAQRQDSGSLAHGAENRVSDRVE